MWVHAEITIYERNTNRKIHDFSVRTLVTECQNEYDAQDKAIEMWQNMFSAYGDVDIDDIWAD